MKKKITIITSYCLLIASLSTSCTTAPEKFENAKEDVQEANKKLKATAEQYLDEIKNYKLETEQKIEANERAIISFKEKIANEKESVKSFYSKKINQLEQKNTAMKRKMEEYKVNGKDRWLIFKREFNKDMDELGTAFEDLKIKKN